MIVNCARYDQGCRREGDLSLAQAAEAARETGSFVWVGIAEPSAEEFDALAEQFDLHELAVEDALHAHQLPKVEMYGETMLVVVKTAQYVDSDEVIELGELVIFVHATFIIVVRHGDGPLTAVRERMERRTDLLAHGPGAVLYAILDHVVDDYELAAQGVDVDIQQVESDVFSPEVTNPAQRIYKLEREVLAFYAAVAPLAEAVSGLARGHYELIPDPLQEYFRDVHDHLRRASGRVNAFRELLTSALQANLTQVSVRQNEDMRKISAWVAILAVPTMIAGIYGMNFDHMPELHERYGYPVVLLVILVACLLLYRRFKRSGWL